MRKLVKQSVLSVMLSCTMGVSLLSGVTPASAKGILEKNMFSTQAIEGLNQLIISDFENTTSEVAGGWSFGGGWQYDHSVRVEIATFHQSKMLKLDLDYTGYGDVSWSEAKIQNNFEQSYDLDGRNYLTMDVYYPEAFRSFGIKVFSNAGIDKEANLLEVTDIENGYKKATFAVKFQSEAGKISDLTIGFVGKNTTFNGAIYLDNITISEYNMANDFVEITSVAGEGTVADIRNLPTSVKITDKDADDSAKNLYAYLIALSNHDQVLFGHENDYNKSVSQTATEGDVKEITGSLSGLYGIDTLSLTGAELGISDAKLALETSIQNSVEAAKQGAIITLSAHMPNFTNSKITQNDDGTYDFTTCDFNESKDLSNNCAEQILEGGKYNKQFTQYLDIIGNYALALQEQDIPILFRPFHENTGSWFWWGTGISETTYRSLFRYTVDYLKTKGVHNILYVYSPNGPLTSEKEYLQRYPGDEYVDVLAFDYYDDYNTYPATSDGSFFTNLDKTCEVVSTLAKKRGKISAISETGVRVMKEDGSDNEGLLVKDNPVAKSKTGSNWYQKVCDIADKNGMPYYLVWANFGDTNFYVPYKYSETLGQEMINEFIDFYNNEKSIFANGTNFYGKIQDVKATAYTKTNSYILAPFNQSVIKKATTLRAGVNNGKTVQFVISNPNTKKKVIIKAKKDKTGTISNLYTARFTKKQLEKLGKTDKATIVLKVDGKVKNKLTNISLNKEKDKAPAHVLENFEYYLDDNAMLQNTYSGNSAANCSSIWTLAKKNKVDGTYGGRFSYTLDTTGNEVWTGQVKSLENNDFSKYNGIQMWVKPDGKRQKLVVQVTDSSGEEFEVYLTNFVKGTKAQYVTIPFDSFKGKNGGTLNTSNITKFAIWCNSVIPEGTNGTWHVSSSIYFDEIKAISISKANLKKVNEDGLILTKNSIEKK